jgi:hypothetical protein
LPGEFAGKLRHHRSLSRRPRLKESNITLRLARVGVLFVVLALVGAACGGGTLGSTELSQQAMSLQSNAAEGALLAHDAASGKVTRIFVREHSAELAKAASGISASLRAATTTPSLRPELRRLVAVADEIDAGLRRIGSASTDEQRALGRQLDAAARQSEAIGMRLGAS